MAAVATMLAAVVLSILIAKIATVALTVTGLSREAARFQARSAVTGAGFTTSESERVVAHPVRRRIIMGLMLVGNAGLVTVIATLMLSFFTTRSRGEALLRLALLSGGLVSIVALARSERFDRWLTGVTARLLRAATDLDTRDYARLLKLSGPYSVCELSVQADDWLAGRTLEELKLTDEGIIVLGIQREDGSYIGAPRGSTPILAEDVLIVYGPRPCVAELDQRPAGPEGDRAHEEAAAEHEHVLLAEAVADPARGPESRPGRR